MANSGEPEWRNQRNAHRTAEGKTEVIRCLKRYVAREVWGYLHLERHSVLVSESVG